MNVYFIVNDGRITLFDCGIKAMASLEPVVAWPGHAEPVRGDVRAVHERAARH
jgi:hypothetical protein